MFPIVTHDADRERIRARTRLAHDVLADLEEAAISAASRHGHQVDALKTELAEAQRQLATPSLPFASSMVVGLDDIRTILVEETHTTVQELLVVEDGQVQVVDSIHQLLAHIIAVDTAWPASEMESLRRSLLWTQDELRKANAAALANAQADADYLADADGDLRQAVAELIDSMRPVDVAAARLADNANPTAAIIVVAEALRELTGQILEDGEGETMKQLALARADADRLESELHLIEAACEAAGMAATVEREHIPGWLALHLTTRALKAKAKRKAKSPAVDDEAEDVADAGGADE
jgi:hypothetical protein